MDFVYYLDLPIASVVAANEWVQHAVREHGMMFYEGG